MFMRSTYTYIYLISARKRKNTGLVYVYRIINSVVLTIFHSRLQRRTLEHQKEVT